MAKKSPARKRPPGRPRRADSVASVNLVVRLTAEEMRQLLERIGQRDRADVVRELLRREGLID